MTYRTAAVAVRGGPLRVGVWESADLTPSAAADRTVLGIHGVTSSHLAWALVAELLVAEPGTRVVAPDLRGRGRSAELPGPWGMEQHADDLAAVVAAFGRPQLTVGHSMGGFVAVVAAHRHPGAFGELVLLDGGVPLPLPAGVPMETLLQSVLGPAAARLAMRFPDRQAYRDFWAGHPAFAGAWSPAVAAYVDYDLIRDGVGWRSAARFDAVAQDSGQQGADGILQTAWNTLSASESGDRPAFLRAPAGMLGEPPGLYPPDALDRFAAEHPGFAWTEVPDTNHYTLVLSPVGAERVAAVLVIRLAAVAR